jgi:hypothetical protein
VICLGLVAGFFFDENAIHGSGERQSFGKRWMLGRRTVSASGMGRDYIERLSAS